ncbi:hypothetical protein BK138_23800 [Paenibacillus rhizosphaerae]|uniref:DUF402 domain-containing protein n=1 Tax=Paenibacillus rhizosphaerae TaxID=297318 RepID=A0A1R1EJ78_9BACL|nr:DUF402 domain-containing protein [Paenibacillus rhizosphaerae]OMF51868.1 hypothetical protein BK138_23800 [Paenibacillus rhizosphaerae]
MKRKYADRQDWRRVLERDFACRPLRSEEFNGHVTLISIHQISEPLVVQMQNRDLCLADQGYVWMQQFPEGEHYAVTTMFNAELEIIQWYVDMTTRNGLSGEGIPYWDDLYLDLVVFPDGSDVIKDEDELSEALRSSAITEEDFVLAHRTLNGLLPQIHTGTHWIWSHSKKHLDWMLERN